MRLLDNDRGTVCVQDSSGPRKTPITYSGPLLANTILCSFNTIQPSGCFYVIMFLSTISVNIDEYHFASDRWAKYCDKRVVRLSVCSLFFVCMFICRLAYLKNQMSKFHQICYICYLWP